MGQLDAASLVAGDHEARVEAFDVSPDGRILAVLYEALVPYGKKPAAPSAPELWVAIWDVRSHTVVEQISIAPIRISFDVSSLRAYAYAARELIFTSDQSHLIVCDLGTIWKLDLGSAAEPARVDPPDPTLGKPVAIQALSKATVAVTYETRQENRYYTALFDASSGASLSGFTSSTIPLSFSPNGKLAVALAPGEWNAGGVAGLQVIDVGTGAKLRSVSVGFGFKRRHQDEGGGALPRFLDNARIVAAPDNMTDHTGNHSGYSLEIIDVFQNRIVGDLAPHHFVPSGELAISADRSRFVASSMYAPAWELRSEWFPIHPKYKIFVFTRDKPNPEAVIEGLCAGLREGYSEAVRLSSDGSVIGIADASVPNGGVKIFQISK
jgi:hypothetical protein